MATANNNTASSILITKVESGTSHHIKINHVQTKDIGLDEYVTSPSFSSGGFDWEILYFPHLDDDDPDTSYISFSLTLDSEAWDVRATFDLSLLELDGSPSHHAFKRTSYCFSSQGDSFGYARFVSRTELEEDYVLDDCFTLLCTIYIVGDQPAKVGPESCSLGVPPFDLHEQLGRLLRSSDKADVTFEVEGESFATHRLILAARSPVFDAELFGSMAEASMKCIKIKDMKAWVFKAMLHFLYTDYLPERDEVGEGEAETEDKSLAETVFAQHLLVAADRYGIEGLRVVCEERLCKDVNMESVMTTLDLAERHNCERLKDVCLGFIAVPRNFMRLALSEKYVSLMQSCPTLLSELQEKVSHCSAFQDVSHKNIN